MCINSGSSQPKPPRVQKIAAPPPVQPLQIAKPSRVETKQVDPVKKKPVSYGSKSLKDSSNISRRDAASLLVPLNSDSTGTGGVNA